MDDNKFHRKPHRDLSVALLPIRHQYSRHPLPTLMEDMLIVKRNLTSKRNKHGGLDPKLGFLKRL